MYAHFAQDTRHYTHMYTHVQMRHDIHMHTHVQVVMTHTCTLELTPPLSQWHTCDVHVHIWYRQSWHTHIHSIQNIRHDTHMYTRVDPSSIVLTLVTGTGWRRLIGSLIFIGHFPPKWPIFSGSWVMSQWVMAYIYTLDVSTGESSSSHHVHTF